MRLASIQIYPVKALRGMAVQAASVEPWGLSGDRRWMIVDSLGRLISQREAPGLALIEAMIEGDGIRLASPGRPSIFVPTPGDGQPVEVQMWRERMTAVSAGGQAADWLSTTRGSLCHLVFMADPERARPISSAVGGATDRLSFADDCPLLLTSAASLADLASRSTLPSLAMDRFRANLVVEGPAAWDEDHWREVTIGGVRFEVAGACERCAVTLIDQTTGERQASNEPLKTLLSFRRNARGRPIFGVNLIPRSAGTVVVADDLTAS